MMASEIVHEMISGLLEKGGKPPRDAIGATMAFRSQLRYLKKHGRKEHVLRVQKELEELRTNRDLWGPQHDERVSSGEFRTWYLSDGELNRLRLYSYYHSENAGKIIPEIMARIGIIKNIASDLGINQFELARLLYEGGVALKIRDYDGAFTVDEFDRMSQVLSQEYVSKSMKIARILDKEENETHVVGELFRRFVIHSRHEIHELYEKKGKAGLTEDFNVKMPHELNQLKNFGYGYRGIRLPVYSLGKFLLEIKSRGLLLSRTQVQSAKNKIFFTNDPRYAFSYGFSGFTTTSSTRTVSIIVQLDIEKMDRRNIGVNKGAGEQEYYTEQDVPAEWIGKIFIFDKNKMAFEEITDEHFVFFFGLTEEGLRQDPDSALASQGEGSVLESL